MHARRLILIGTTLLLALLLSSCANGPLYTELTAASYSITRYSNYAPLLLKGVSNPGSRDLTQVVLTAYCKEDTYSSLDHKFESLPFAIRAGETLDQVTLDHVGGYPYFTGFRVGCSFDGYNQRFPLEPEVTVRYSAKP